MAPRAEPVNAFARIAPVDPIPPFAWRFVSLDQVSRDGRSIGGEVLTDPLSSPRRTRKIRRSPQGSEVSRVGFHHRRSRSRRDATPGPRSCAAWRQSINQPPETWAARIEDDPWHSTRRSVVWVLTGLSVGAPRHPATRSFQSRDRDCATDLVLSGETSRRSAPFPPIESVPWERGSWARGRLTSRC